MKEIFNKKHLIYESSLQMRWEETMEELIEKAKDGDKEAFTTLILSVQDDLYRIAELRLKNKEDIFDAIQETVIIAFKSIKKLRHNKYFKTWIIKILINQSNNIFRQRNKRKIISFEEIEYKEESNSYDIDNMESIINFNFICNNLKYEDRLIIILYYMEQFTDKEIGQILGMKEKTVTTKRTRAKKKIKDYFQKGEKGDGR